MTYGNLINRILENSQQREPEVGMPVTIAHWSDRTVGYVNEIIRFRYGKRIGQIKAIRVVGCTATRIDSNGMSDAQNYEYEAYEPKPKGSGALHTADKDGRFPHVILGIHDYHYDYSF